MARRIVCVGWLILGVIITVVGAIHAGAQEGPTLLGPDARPPRMEPTVRERQPEPPIDEVSPGNDRSYESSGRSSVSPAARRPYLSQTAPRSQAEVDRYRQQQAQQRTAQAYRQAPTQRSSAPAWANDNRAAESQYRRPPQARSAQPTPEELQRYRMQVQERAKSPPRDPWRQGTPYTQRRPNPQTGSTHDSGLTQPKRNYRALFEPPGARQTRAPGQPRRIVIGGGYPSSSDPNMPNSAAQRLGSADGRRPTINSGPTPREILQ